MTTLEIILLIIVIYLIITHIFNFICIANNGLLADYEDLIINIFWIITIPIALIKCFSNYLDERNK